MDKKLKSKINKVTQEKKRAQKSRAVARYYDVSSILGNDWAIFYAILGARKTGKSYAVTDFMCAQKRTYKDKCKNYWLRLSETSTKKLLLNKADKLVDPDLRRRYGLDLKVKGSEVFNHGELFMEVLPVSGFAKDKGIARYDKDYDGYYNIALDEFEIEDGEKKTSFDILYGFIQLCENIVRTTKSKVRIFLLGNTLEEASSILKAFNFLPHQFGRYYLKSKRCVIDNLEPTEEYFKDRKGSVADLLGGDTMSNYTNELTKDQKLIYKGRIRTPSALIMFGKERNKWYTLWDGKVIRKYRGEGCAYKIAMRPYLDEAFNREKMISIFDRYDAQNLLFTDLISQAYFTGDLAILKKGR